MLSGVCMCMAILGFVRKIKEKLNVCCVYRGKCVCCGKNLLVIFVSWSVCRVMACDVFLPGGGVVFVRRAGCCFSAGNIKNMTDVVWFMAKGNVWHMVCAKTREATLCFLMIIITFATAKN